jgi:prepilin-type N-terminal cleavage/methylation domain-containing protein
MKHMRKSSGLTMLEVMIASAILSVVVIITLDVLFSGTNTAVRSGLSSALEHRGRKLVSEFTNDVLDARYKLDRVNKTPSLQSANPWSVAGVSGNELGIYSNNTELRFIVAGNQDQSGNALPGGQMCWGYHSPLATNMALVPRDLGFRQDLACYIRFEADTVLRESSGSPSVPSQPASWGSPFPPLPTLDEQILNIDVDKNGSMNDTFVHGRIRKYIVAPAGHPILTGGQTNPLTIEGISDDVILKVSSGNTFNGSMDGTPTSGLLFQFVDKTGATAMTGSTPSSTATALVLTVWHGTLDDRKKDFWLRQASQLIHFRASQN